jgi:glycosyltransferase involved in cell wall biosynthesis
MGAPEVSIVIATYNRSKQIQEVLSSYLTQPYLKELIIVDDGSTDGTREFFEKHYSSNKQVIYLRHPDHRGTPFAKNTGIAYASGNYICIGEDDLYFSRDYVKTLVDEMNSHNADLAGGRLIYLKEEESLPAASRRVAQSLNDKPYLNPYTLAINYYGKGETSYPVPMIHACALLKAHVAKELLIDTVYIISFLREETDLYLRAGKKGYKVLYVPGTSVYHLPMRKMKGGSRDGPTLAYHLSAIRNNYIFSKRHFGYLRGNGVKTNFLVFNVIHALNRVRIYFRRNI